MVESFLIFWLVSFMFKVIKLIFVSFCSVQQYVTQQGEFESFHRDLMVAFGKWEFDPMDIKNPFPNNEGSVHLWQGDEDRLSPVILQRFIANKLSWIQYHEFPGEGHLFPFVKGTTEALMKKFLIGNK